MLHLGVRVLCGTFFFSVCLSFFDENNMNYNDYNVINDIINDFLALISSPTPRKHDIVRLN